MNPFIQRALLAALPAAVLTISCTHGGSSTVGGGGTTPPPPPVFTIDELNGDWVGQLTPDNPARLVQNVYLRFVNEDLATAADSAGNEWTEVNSERIFSFDADGLLEANLGLLVGVSGLEIQAEMDDARAVITGVYTQVGPDLFPVSGTLELVRSTGPAMFTEAMLAGDWVGDAVNEVDRSQILEFTLDASGVVVTGAMIRPGLKTVRRTYSAGAGAFSIFDGGIGRLENVTLTADNGVESFLHYMLLDRDATLLAGPGTDNQLGSGRVRLNK
jgi:hypothetical protein